MSVPIIITSGGTSERIDGVRTITNISSGRLALAVTLKLLQHISDVHVHYICGERALVPSAVLHQVTVTRVRNTQDLADAIDKLHSTDPFAFIHSMAVSDFSPVFREGKMPSDIKNPSIQLKANPKVINMIRETFPKTILFGFKLESGVSPRELIKRGQSLIDRSACNYAVVNLVEDISLFFHNGLIIDRNDIISTFYSKSDCGKKIAEIIKGRMI